MEENYKDTGRVVLSYSATVHYRIYPEAYKKTSVLANLGILKYEVPRVSKLIIN